MSKVIECPNCKGKGHVFEAVMILCPLLWPIALFELNTKHGLTRDDCSHCGGSGFVRKPGGRP